MIESTYSVSSFCGFVSSKRRLVCPANSSARQKSRQIALACPMCRYPFGSGGKRVCTRPPYLFVFKSSIMMSRMKFEARVSGTVTPPSTTEFDFSITLLSLAIELEEYQGAGFQDIRPTGVG